MRRSFRWALPALLLAGVVGIVSADTGLSGARSGLGLKPLRAAASAAEDLSPRDPFADVRHALGSGDAVYGGAREWLRPGVSTPEFYGGLAYSLSDALAASLELDVMHASGLSSRRYSLAGRLHTAFAGGSGLSIGLAYRVYEPDVESPSLDAAPGNGYALVPVRVPGTGIGPSYQLQLNYQYSAATTFGFVLGRELETFIPGFDLAGTGLRQLSITGQHWLTPSWALSYDVLSNDPGAFRLQGLRFGVRYRF